MSNTDPQKKKKNKKNQPTTNPPLKKTQPGVNPGIREGQAVPASNKTLAIILILTSEFLFTNAIDIKHWNIIFITIFHIFFMPGCTVITQCSRVHAARSCVTSGAHEFIPSFKWGSCCSIFNFQCIVL